MSMLDINKDILLFYRKHEHDFPNRDFNRTVSGFMAWYQLLVQALTKSGFTVHENDFDLAAANPDYPIGLVGTPLSLKNWDLPNPAILGPSMYDHPRLNPGLMGDRRYRYYLFTCEWLRNLFQPFYGDKCVLWHAGVDIEKWPDVKKCHKDIDVLIYDKMRWTRDIKEKFILQPILEDIGNRRLNSYVLKYGNISRDQYKDLLSRSRSMIFLCEHETQGMAYQEALASNVPVLAWDPGYWVDPLWEIFSENPVPSTSVPQFSDQCGAKFKKVYEFNSRFSEFYSTLDIYEPRKFAEENLSLKKSAEVYYGYYKSCCKK